MATPSRMPRRVHRASIDTPRGTMSIAATNERRAVYEEIKRLEKANKGAYISDSYLRLEVALSTNAVASSFTTIRFSVLTNEGQAAAPRASEYRLQPADAFYVERMGFFLGLRLTANGTSTANLQTFESASIFGAGNVPGIRTIQAGRINIKINSIEYIRALDILGLKYAGTAQDGVAPSVGDLWDASAFDLGKQLYPLVPTVRFNGGSTNEVTIQLPEAATLTAAANSEISAVLYCKGWLAQNCGRFNPLENR